MVCACTQWFAIQPLLCECKLKKKWGGGGGGGEAWERRIPRPLNCFQVGYRVGQGFVSRNASRNTRGHVQGEVLLVPLISCSNEATTACVGKAELVDAIKNYFK